MGESKRKRRWWQLGIRDALWLTAVVALAVGWGVNRAQLTSARNEASNWKTMCYELSDSLASAQDKASMWKTRCRELEDAAEKLGFEIIFPEPHLRP